VRFLVTGSGGMLGSDSCSVFRARGHEVIAAGRAMFDVTDSSAVHGAITRVRPDVVFHAAAHVDADEGERSPDLAYRINTIGTCNVAVACARERVRLAYVSSCGVFDGSKATPYTELDAPDPLTQHHRSKWFGERVVASLIADHLILRPGWLFGGSAAHKKNFVARRYDEAAGKDSIVSAVDRFGSPTYTMDFAAAALDIIEGGYSGIFHVVNDGHASRFEYVSECIAALGLPTKVNPVSSDSFPRSAPSPRSEALQSSMMKQHNLPPLRPWRDALHEYTKTRLLPELRPVIASRT
jgi:dTDP-4-dehydrorhamnose reductase